MGDGTEYSAVIQRRGHLSSAASYNHGGGGGEKKCVPIRQGRGGWKNCSNRWEEGGIVLLFAAVKGEKGNNRQEGEKKGEESRKKGVGCDPRETRGGIVLVGMGFAPSRF